MVALCKLSSSQARKGMASLCESVLVGILVSSFAGCETSIRGLGPSNQLIVEQAAVGDPAIVPSELIDAGVVFADKANYLCIPLSRLGLTGDDVVLSATSSCECIRPSIVTFHATSNTIGRALRVEFENKSDPNSSVPANLSVEVTLELERGALEVVMIQFLLTTESPVAEAQIPIDSS